MKLAVMGTGWIAEKFIDAVRRCNAFEPWAIYSRDEKKGAMFARKNGLAQHYDSFPEMIEKSGAEVVYIATPNSLHFSQAIACMQKGLHVIVEKPAVATSAQAKELLACAKANDVYFFEAIRTIHLPALKKIKDALSEIAPIRYAYFNHMKYSSKYDSFLRGEKPPVFLAEYAGGANLDLAIYCVYDAVCLFGEPNAGIASAVTLPGGADAVSVQVLNYGSFLCTIASGKVSDSSVASEIQGERGTIRIDNINDLQKVFLRPRGGAERLIVDESCENDMIYEATEFRRILDSGDTQAWQKLNGYLYKASKLTEQSRLESGYRYPCDQKQT